MTTQSQSVPIAALAVLAGAALLGLKAGFRKIQAATDSSPSAIVVSPSGSEPTLSRVENPAPLPTGLPKDLAWKATWQRALAQAPSPERTAALATALAELRATSPDIATREFLALEPADRVAIVAHTLAAAADRGAEEAVHEAIRVCDEDPAYALDYGHALLNALAKTGDYAAALSFVLAEDAVDGWLGENGHKWLTALFVRWAQAAPAEAMQVAQESIGANYRGEALQVVAAVWAKADPATAANSFGKLPPSPDRERALAIALRQWSEVEPAAASAWMATKREPLLEPNSQMPSQ